MNDISIPAELLELVTGRPLHQGEKFDFNDLRKVIHQMKVTEVHKEDKTVSVEIFAVNEKTYNMTLPAEWLEKVTIH